MKRSKYIIIMIFSIFNLTCYSQNTDTYVAKKLTDHAANILTRNSGNDDSLRLAIYLLDSAITLDKIDYHTYTIKSQIECTMGEYDSAISDIDRALLLKGDFVEMKTSKGFIYEKMGEMDKAMDIYKDVLSQYDLKMKNGDSCNINVLINRAFIILLLHGNESGKLEYDKISQEYKSNQYVKNLHDTFYFFDRKKFMLTFCQK